MKCARPHPEDSQVPATVQRVTNPRIGIPFTEWLQPDQVTFTEDAKAEKYVGPYEEALKLAQKISKETGEFVYPVDADPPLKEQQRATPPVSPIRPPARCIRPARPSGHRSTAPRSSFAPDHNCGRPRSRPELDARDLRLLEEHEIYD